MKTRIYYIISIFSLLLGCNNESNQELLQIEETSPEVQEVSNAINLINEFSSVVNDIEVSAKSSSLSLSLSDTKTLFFDAINTKSGNTPANDSITLYTFDLEINGTKGFAIASGDERVGRVYAYVENGSLSDTSYIYGMTQMITDIPKICEQDIENYDSGSVAVTKSKGVYPEGKTTSPALEWGQGAPYNYGTPSSSCSSGYYAAGCGVIAMAQTIAFYGVCDQYFDFEALTAQKKITTSSSTALQNEVSSFVAHVGGLCDAIYGCSEDGGTSTYFSVCANVLTDLGYTYNSSDELDGRMVRDVFYCNRDGGNMVLCRGADTYGRGGHMWAICGIVCLVNEATQERTPQSVLCNWGWNGTSNGWYSLSNEAYNKPIDTDYDFSISNRSIYINMD